MKKINLLFLFVALLVFSGILLGCNLSNDNPTNGDGPNNADNAPEVFVGSASTETYDSLSLAAQGYLKNELSGSNNTAVYVQYESDRELTQEEIEKLQLSEADMANLVSAEKGYVVYQEVTSQSTVSREAESSKTFKRLILILVYRNDNYKYVSLMAEEGETLTASYFDSVFDVDKYLNCTLNMSVFVSMTSTYNSELYELAYSTQQSEAKCATDAFMQTTQATIRFEGVNYSTSTEQYAWDAPNGINVAQRLDDNDWSVVSDFTQIDSVSTLLLNNFYSLFGTYDSTYFQKNKDGYELRADKAKEWFANFYDGFMQGSDLGEQITEMINSMDNFVVEYKVTVTDGTVSAISIRANFTMEFDGVPLNINTQGQCTYSNFGSTSVVIPDEVKYMAAN